MRGHAVAAKIAADDQASIVTMGLAVWKPSHRASNSGRLDAKASSSNHARRRSHRRRWRPSWAHTAWHQAPHRGWVCSTTHAHRITVAHTTARCGGP
jgi:hypothetical protein